jgi:hypothetical protein
VARSARAPAPNRRVHLHSRHSRSSTSAAGSTGIPSIVAGASTRAAITPRPRRRISLSSSGRSCRDHLTSIAWMRRCSSHATSTSPWPFGYGLNQLLSAMHAKCRITTADHLG